MDWQTIQIPFSAGLDQRGEVRAQNPPILDVCIDAQFGEVGGLQTRKPYAALGTNILGGGTISNPRRIVANGNELLLFTADTLYSWDAQAVAWVAKGTYLAVKVAEQTIAATTGDQVDADRAELSNVIVYAWTDNARVFAAAVDKQTGAIIVAPTQITGAVSRPRLIAVSTKILFFWHTGTDAAPVSLVGIAIDPANVATSLAAAPTTILATPNFGSDYDACLIPSSTSVAIAARRVTTTSYSVLKVTEALAVTASTKARECDFAIAIAATPDGLNLQVVRSLVAGSAITGDLVGTSALADVFTGQAIGTYGNSADRIAAAFRTVKNGGHYRCYVFWASGEGTGPNVKSNWVDDGNSLGTAATFLNIASVASRAFDYNGSVYFNAVFAAISGFSGANASAFRAQLQNTYFLYRDDGFLVAKSAANIAGGYCASKSHLPGVALTASGTYSWCGGNRRVIPTGSNQSGYSKRAPRDITYTFDSNEARRTARLGRTLYIAGGEVLAYDGVQLAECSYHIYPWDFAAIEVGSGGAMPTNTTYAYKITWRWDNANGEIDRSTTATVGTVTTSIGSDSVQLPATQSLYITHKTASAPAIEVWRTVGNPTSDSPFYLVTSNDPSVTANPNRYLANNPAGVTSTLTDGLADSALTVLATNPENAGVLENLAPPAATIIAATDERIFLAGVAGDPDRVRYSKLRNDGEVAAFHDALTINVPREGGSITGLAFLNETLIVFRQTAIYAFPGTGYDNTGQGQNYGPARILSINVGANSPESIALLDAGLMFKGQKGWHLLTKGWDVQYLGGKVQDYDAEDVSAISVVPFTQQIRIVDTQSRILIFDYFANQWGEWSVSDGIGGCIWQNAHVYLGASGAKVETTTGYTFGMDVETAWIKLADLQGAGRVRWISILGQWISAFHLRIRIARDYLQDGSGNWLYSDDLYWTPSPTVANGPLQVRIGPSTQQVEAIKIRLTASSTNNDGTPPTAGASLQLTGLALEVGIKRGIYKRLAAAQKV